MSGPYISHITQSDLTGTNIEGCDVINKLFVVFFAQYTLHSSQNKHFLLKFVNPDNNY